MTRTSGALRSVRARPAPVILVAVLAAFAVQLGVTLLQSEPYPALSAPAFYGTGGGSKTLTVKRPEVLITDTRGAVTTVSAGALFDVPLYPDALAVNTFSRGLDQTGAPKRTRGKDVTGLLAPLETETPGWTRDGTSPRAYAPDTVAWLRARARALLPAGSPAPASVTVVWQDLTFQRNDPDRAPVTEDVQRVEVDL